MLRMVKFNLRERMLEEFEKIVGTERYSVFMEMLEQIGPDARTHRISVVIAAMMQFALDELINDYMDGPLARALIAFGENDPDSGGKDEAEALYEFIDELCSEVGMTNERESARGDSYSIAENVIEVYSNWYAMPWDSY